jgi:hypothetical protein
LSIFCFLVTILQTADYVGIAYCSASSNGLVTNFSVGSTLAFPDFDRLSFFFLSFFLCFLDDFDFFFEDFDLSDFLLESLLEDSFCLVSIPSLHLFNV